jgi:hypothetical protein
MRRVTRASLALIFASLLGFVAPLSGFVRAQTLTPGEAQPAPTELSQAFVVYQTPDGDVTCRAATPAEAREINSRSSVPLRQINHLKETSDQTFANGGTSANAIATGLTIVLRGTAQLEANLPAKQAFINAAAKWEALIKDPITVTIDVDFGTTAFGNAFSSTNTLGVTSSSGFLVDYPTVRQQLINRAASQSPGGSEELTMLNSLPTGSLPTDIGTIPTVFVPPSLMSALNISATNPTAPKIGFNSDFNFDFDPTDGVTTGQSDFDSVAVHEIGHALGFTSEAGARELNPSRPLLATIWDLYRFKPSTASTANFSTAQRVLTSGASTTDRRVQFNGNAEFDLSTGKPDGTGGDGQQSSHWKDDAQGVPFIGIMDPTIRRGTHLQISANDLRAIDFFGYNVGQLTTSSTGTSVQFASPSASASETSGSAQLTVTRNGDLSTTSSVLVKTLDDTRAIRCDDTTSAPGVAFARCDYATTVQTVTFAPNETTKTVAVPLIDDSFGEPNESVTLALSGAAGAVIGAQSTTTLTITSNEAPGQTGANPIFDPTFFVRMQYLDFLSREPDAGGMAAWVGTLNGCAAGNTTCDRASVSANFFRSPEFQSKGLFVFNFYKVSLSRLPLYAEIVADMSSLTDTTPAGVNAKRAAFTDAWVQRSDFLSQYAAMDNATFVSTLMNRYFAVTITTINPATPDDPSAKVTLTSLDLINRLNGVGGTLTRAQVVRAIASSDEVSRTEFNSAFVAMQYFGYLRRDPDTQGFNDWLRTINANPNDVHSMVSGFANSIEYNLRFGPQQ